MDMQALALALGAVDSASKRIKSEIEAYVGSGIEDIDIIQGEDGNSYIEFTLKKADGSIDTVSKKLDGILTQEQRLALTSLLSHITFPEGEIKLDGKSPAYIEDLSGGDVSQGNNKFVTGDQVNTAIENIDIPEVDTTGVIESGNSKIVTGGTVYEAIQNIEIPDIQYSSMPYALQKNEGKVVQFIGETNNNYVNGYFYKCSNIGNNVYKWVNISVVDYDKIWTGTNDELSSLSENEKEDYILFITTDDEVENTIFKKEFSNNAVWEINHNLNSIYLTVLTYDSNGEQIIGGVEYTSSNSLTVTFSKAVSGRCLIIKQ